MHFNTLLFWYIILYFNLWFDFISFLLISILFYDKYNFLELHEEIFVSL
jgi:hypothetical protein